MAQPTPFDPSPVWFDENDVDLQPLLALANKQTSKDRVPLASEVVHQIPVYDGASVRSMADVATKNKSAIKALQAEWIDVLLHGAGVIVIRQAEDDIDMLDSVTQVLLEIMQSEAAGEQVVGDHFAAAGSNSRIWNTQEKLCMHSPELFAHYMANEVLALMCSAWLGPAYQITAQANIVHPGGRAQVCHRDYHLGFQDRQLLADYPAHVHTLSPLLTLQGGTAHSDVPIESGPTQLLPFSQQLQRGYMDVHDERFIEYFNAHRVQLPLAKGDMMFFNPALFHAAGDNNTTDFDRFVNLFQVGSAYGRTLEIVDRSRMSIHLYPVLQSLLSTGSITWQAAKNAIAACAEGYPFPANLDLEPPTEALASSSQQHMMLKALEEGISPGDFTNQITAQKALKRSL